MKTIIILYWKDKNMQCSWIKKKKSRKLNYLKHKKTNLIKVKKQQYKNLFLYYLFIYLLTLNITQL